MSAMPAPPAVTPQPWHRNLFFVQEETDIFKAVHNYMRDPQTGQVVLECREENVRWLPRILRINKDFKGMTPFEIHLKTPGGQTVARIKRGWSFFLCKVDVFDGEDKRIGGFKQKFFSFGGAFRALDNADQLLFELKGNWINWEFKFLAGERELGSVTKEWAGIGQEMFTTADNYVLKISDQVGAEDPVRKLILAAVVCIDMVLKE